MTTTTESPHLRGRGKPYSGAPSVRARTSDVLRRIDEGVEAARRATARSIVWESLLSGWDEPANELYADLWMDWDAADRYLFDDVDDVEERAGITWATLMGLEDEFVGPQTPPDLHSRPPEHEWEFELVGDVRGVDDTPANLEAAAYQIAVIGDVGLLWRIPSYSWDRSFHQRIANRVYQLIRELSLEHLPPGSWRPTG